MAYLPLILEGHLADSHAAIFLEIFPWRVYYRDVVFLIAYELGV